MCAGRSGGPRTPRPSSPGIVRVKASQGERGGGLWRRGDLDLLGNAAPIDIPSLLGGGGGRLQEPQFESEEAGGYEIGRKSKLAHGFVHLGF